MSAPADALLVEADVLHAPTIGDAVDHDRQPLHMRLPAAATSIVKDDRPGAVLCQLPLDLMFTQFWFPGQKSNAISEATFVVEREVGAHADVFVEYVGDYPNHGAPSQLINSGGAYRLTGNQQIDFHAGFGLTNRSPSYFFGVGYSVRFDGLF